MGLDMPGHRFNDATVDANGALWVSTMARDLAKGEAAIYRVSRTICVCSRWSRALPSPTAWRSMWNEAGFTIPNSHWDVQTVWTRRLSMSKPAEAGEPMPSSPR